MVQLSPKTAPSSSEGVHVFGAGTTPAWVAASIRPARVETAGAPAAGPAAVHEEALATRSGLGTAGLSPPACKAVATTGSIVLARMPMQPAGQIYCEGIATSPFATRVEGEGVDRKRLVDHAENGQQATIYSDETDDAHRFDGGDDRMQRRESAGSIRGSCMAKAIPRKPLCAAGSMIGSSCDGGMCGDEVSKVSETYTATGSSGSRHSSRKNSNGTDRVTRCLTYHEKERKTTLLFTYKGADVMAPNSTSSLVLMTAAGLQLERCYGKGNAPPERNHMRTNGQGEAGEGPRRPLLQPQKTHERQHEHEEVQLREHGDRLQVQECGRKHQRAGEQPHESRDADQELQPGMLLPPLHRVKKREGTNGSNVGSGGEDGRQLHSSALQRASVATSARRLVISCCNPEEQVKASNNLEEQRTGPSLSTVIVEGATGTSHLHPKTCYNSSIPTCAYAFTHTPFVSQFPQLLDSATAARCSRGQPSDKFQLASYSAHHTIKVGSATFAASSLPHSQLTDSASQCSEVAPLGGSTRLLRTAPLKNPANAATHWSLADSSAARLDTVALSSPDDCLNFAETSAFRHDIEWQRSSGVVENIQCAKNDALGDLHNSVLGSQVHSAVTVPNDFPVFHLATSICESSAGSASPGPLYTKAVDRLHQEKDPQGSREHQPSPGQLCQEEQEQSENQPGVGTQRQRQARRVHAGRHRPQEERDAVHSAKQDFFRGQPAGEGEARRKWLGAVAPTWVQAVAAGSGALTMIAKIAGNGQEAHPDSVDSTFAASRSCGSTAVSIYSLKPEKEEQHADKEAGWKRFTKRGSLVDLQPSAAASEERVSHRQVQDELLRYPQHNGLLQQQQRETLSGRPLHEIQQHNLGGSYSNVELRVKSNDNKAECAPIDTHSSDSSGAILAEQNSRRRWEPDEVESRRTAASVVSCCFMQTCLNDYWRRRVEDETLCVGAPASQCGVCSKAETCTEGTWFSPCLATCVREPPCAPAATSMVVTTDGARRCYRADCKNTGERCPSHVERSYADCADTAVSFQKILPYPQRFLRNVGVVGAPASTVAEPGAVGEINVDGGDRKTPKEEQSKFPQPIGRSQSVLKRAASADPASGRFARVKTVSFANLNEYENSVVGRTTATWKGIEPDSVGADASASLPVCISDSNKDAALPREIGKAAASHAIRSEQNGAAETTSPKRGAAGDPGEREKAEVTLEMQIVDPERAKRKEESGRYYAASHEGAGGAKQTSSRGESSVRAMERKKFPKRRFGPSLAAAVGVLQNAGQKAGAVAGAEQGAGGRQGAEEGDGLRSPRRDLRSSSSSLLSEDTVMRRRGDVASAGRGRGQFHSVNRSSGGEESGADSSGADRGEGSQRRRGRGTNRRRDRRPNDGIGSSTGSHRGTRGSAYRARRGDRPATGAPPPPSLESFVGSASTRLTQIFRNFFRAIQNLTEHDTVFHMQDELSVHGSRLLPRGATPGSEVTGGGSSVSSALAAGAFGSRSSPRSGVDSATGTGLPQGISATESVTGSVPAGGSTARGAVTAESSLSRSGSSDVLLRRLPLKFVDGDLEDLFAGNINKWMTARLLLMGLLMLVVTSLMWPLMAWSFNLQDAFNHNEPIGVLFHVDMSLNVVVSLLFIVTRFSNILTDHAELIGDAGTFLVLFVMCLSTASTNFSKTVVCADEMQCFHTSCIGLVLPSSLHQLLGALVVTPWNESSYVRDVINPQSTAGHQGYVSLEKTTSWSTAQEASSAVAYLYGLLLIVQLDVVYPSRTRRTWQIHLMFFLLSASSIIVRGAINPNFVPVPFVVIRVATYLMLTVFLYVGRHATELQQRQTFYNWLMTRKRVDRLESDLKRQKDSGKVSTAVEQLVDLIRQCKETFQSLEAGLPDTSPFHRTQLDECNRTLDHCLSILTNTTNLYTVQFGDLDSDTHRDIIQAFLNTHNSSPADWARMTRGAFSNADAGPFTSALSQAARQPSGESKAFDHGITLDVLTFPGAPTDTPVQRPSSTSHGSSDVACSSLSSKGFAEETQVENGPLRRASTAGLGSTSASPAPCLAPTTVGALPGRATAAESKISPQETSDDALFDFSYASPRGREFSDEERVHVQSTSTGTRQSEDQKELLPGVNEGKIEKGDSAMRTMEMPEGWGGAHRGKRGRFAYLMPRTAVAARDVGLRRKRSSGLPLAPLAGREAARGGAIIATAGEYKTPSNSTNGEIPEKHVDSRIPRDGRAIRALMEAGAGPTVGRDVPSPTVAQPTGVCVVEGAEGRRLSSAVTCEEIKEEAMIGTLGMEKAQQKDVRPRGRVTHPSANGRRPSPSAAGVSTGRKDTTGGPMVYRAFVMDQRARGEMRARNEAVARVLGLPTGSPQLNFVPRLSEEEVLAWDFDCLLYAKESPAPLLDVGYALLSRPCENLSLPNKEILVRFLMAVEAQYNAVPYHNSIHGCMVTQKMIALTHLMHLTNKVSNRDLAVMIVAGLCHDIGHPGRNNALLINAIDPVAVLYNDKSVLENYHSCLTFKTLDLPDCDIFWILRSKLRREYHVMRSLIIELILATDMKNHFETVSRFRIRRLASDFDISGEEDLWFLLKIVIKCADLSHCGVNWSQHFEWCLRLCTEFYDQGDEELARHLPVSPLCEREKHAEVAKAQLGFMNFVTIPLYEELVAVDTTGSVECYCISYMKANVRNWELTASAGVHVPYYGKDLTPDVQPPFSQLLDPNQHAKQKPGSKAAEIANRYARVVLTCVDLTPLVMRTQLSRSQRDSQLLTDLHSTKSGVS